MPSKEIVYFGEPVVMSCDGRCDKAFGINGRPKHSFSDDPDDTIMLPDRLVPDAPPPGKTAVVAEGSYLKPSATPLIDASLMNKWCARECERRSLSKPGEPIFLRDMDKPRPNLRKRDNDPMPWTGES